MTNTIHLNIKGMTCQHCVMRASKALELVSGVDSVEITLEPGAAKITGSVTADMLVTAVKDAGYQAEVAA